LTRTSIGLVIPGVDYQPRKVIVVRPERPGDRDAIRRVNELAFGFRPARTYGIETPCDAPDEAWMALPLPAYDERLRGTVLYPRAWRSV
jgi:predicted N-acetyltransferase YhbS